MKKQNKKVQKDFLWHLQLHFVILAGLFLLATLGFSVFAMISQLQYNEGYGGSAYYLLSSLAAPIIALALSYFLAPKSSSKVTRIFWVVVLAFIAMLLYVVVQQVSYILPFSNEYYAQGSWMLNESLRMAVCYLPVVAYFGYVYWLRKKLAK